jgi:hypothetical protein
MNDRQLRCQRHLLTLRMQVLSTERAGLSRRAGEIRDATNAIIAEVEAMSRAVLADSQRDPKAETFLWVRVTRLAVAADQVVRAAHEGDLAALDAHLRHFETLTSAIWTVKDEVYGREPALVR